MTAPPAAGESDGVDERTGELPYTVGRVQVDVLDIVLLVFVVVFAVSGYRQGFIIGLLSFVGFLGGGVLGVFIAPAIAAKIVSGSSQRALLAIVIVFLIASIGQFLASSLGAAVRSRVTWDAAAHVDSLGGAVVSMVSVLLIAWLIGTAVAHAPFPAIARQVQGSAVLAQMDRVMPDQARTWFSEFQKFVGQGPFPQVFGGLGGERFVQVAPPDKKVLKTHALRRSRHSVVKILGEAPGCDRTIEGTGFVYGPNRVMTNAHVVAGVRGGPEVYTMDGGASRARVVLYDPQRDIAVLDVPGLSRRALNFDHRASTGDSAVVAGYPRNKGFKAVPARVRGSQEARGPNIYGDRQVVREIYSLRAKVEPGNSGGPLLAPNGNVYGVVFAAATDDPDTGYALTAREIAPDAKRGLHAVHSVSTGRCD